LVTPFIEDGAMPYVNVRITREGTTREQKAQVIAEITDTLERVLGKSPDLTHIVIDEIALDDWGFKGKQVSEERKPADG
jgi:4-oxalocrotonate tautomerase